MSNLRIVHLSDLHIRKGNEVNYNINIIEPLIKSLKKEDAIKKINFICITGDLIDKGNGGFESSLEAFEYVEKTFISKLVTELSLVKESIIFCPGNHDVDTSKDPSFTDNGIEQQLTSTQAVREYMDNIESYKFQGVERILGYKQFEKNFYKDIKETDVTYFETTHKKELENLTIGFASLNSVWRYYSKNSKVLIGTSQIVNSVEKLKDCNIKILLSHYPFDKLQEFERKGIENSTSESFQIQLFGHNHSQKSYGSKRTNGGVFFSDTAKGLFVENASSENINYQNGYSIIDYIIDEAKIELYVKSYSQERNEFVNDTLSVGDSGVFVYKLQFNNEDLKDLHKISDDINTRFLGTIDNNILSYRMTTVAPTTFSEIFVEPRFVDRKSDSTEEEKNVEMKQIIENEGNYIILGMKEIGKTVLLDYLVKFYNENINIYRKIPVYIDYLKKTSSSSIESCISQFTGKPILKLKEHISEYKFLLLIDNLDFRNPYFIRDLKEFVSVNKTVSFIATVQIDFSRNIPLPLLESPLIDICDVFEMRYFNKKQIAALTNKWYSKTGLANNKDKKEKIIKLITSLELPRTPLAISMFLWIFEKQEDYQPVNRASVVENFIEKMFKKQDPKQIYYSEFDFKNKEKLLTEIAYEMYKQGNENYSIRYTDLLNFTSAYLKEKFFDYSAKKLIDDFVSVTIFDMEEQQSDSIVRFRFNCFFQYFLMKNFDNEDFMNHVLAGENYLAFAEEINLYTGLKRDSLELLDFVIEKMCAYFKDLQDEKDRKGFSFDDFFETTTSLTEQISSKNNKLLERSKKEFNESLDSFEEEQLDNAVVNDKVEKKSFKYTGLDKLQQSLIIAANVLRNSEEISKPEKKYDSFKAVLNCSLIFVSLYKQIYFDYLKDKYKSFSKEKQKETAIFVSILPLLNEALLEDQLGTSKLNAVVLKHIDSIMKNKKVSQLEKFSTVFLYSDFKGHDFLKVISAYISNIRGNYARDMTLFKLVSYYYLRSNSSETDLKYERIIADLIDKSHKGKKRQMFINKAKIMLDYRQRKKEYIKEQTNENME